jgi:DNA or RNA helicases of superfamily II
MSPYDRFHVVLTRDSDSPAVEIDPWIPALSDILVYETQSFTPGDRFPKVEKHSLYWLADDQKTGYFPVGILRRVVKFLTKRGYEIEGKDLRDRSRYFPEPNWDVVHDLRPGQKEVLDAVVKADTGLIVCPTGFGKSYVVTLLVQMYPTLNFLIVAPGIAETNNLYKRIIEVEKDVALLNGASRDDPNHRVVVSTSRSFLKADLQKTDIFIFDEAHACGNNQTTQDILNNLRGSRIFGFTATPKGRSDKADRLIEAVFGQKLVDFGYEDAKEAGNVTPIEVQVYSVPGRIEASKSRFGNAMTQNRRRFYWRNDIRNNLIRAVADRVPEDEQLLIMVDTVEHLIRLGAMMPGFALVCGDGHDLAEEARRMKLDLSKNILGDTKEVYNELADRFSKGLLKRVIATYRWKQAVDFPQLSVLIRADGAKSPIISTQVPGRLSRLSPDKSTGLLVDFMDEFNDSARRKALARIKSYRENGWRITHMGVFDEQSTAGKETV